MDLSQLIETLAAPAAYPYPVNEVEVRQTHISVVFLAGPFVYKVKKPVRLSFADFSTVERRRHFCEEEVRLNRRLAPEVYLGVRPVVRGRAGVRFEGEGEVLDWAVKMQRLPGSATVHERLERDEVGADLAAALARRVASFHREAERDERMAVFGRFDAVSRLITDNFMQAVPGVGTAVHAEVFERIQVLAGEALAQLRPLIEARARRGMTRDCHGDLHLDHVYVFPDRPPPADLVVIDCIEFNERFRLLDPVADMAFAAMDFAFHGRRDLARAFADGYFAAAGDDEGRTLLPLYTAYRAAVRGSVDGLLLAEPEVPEAERTAALRRARGHWLLAMGQLEEPARRPCLVLVAGLPGTGKSSLAQALAHTAGFCVVRSDVVRKGLAGLPLSESAPPELRESLYTRDWNERTYAECLRRAEQLLFEGNRVIVDATFREEAERRRFLAAAVGWGVPACILLCRAEAETVRQRLGRRTADASDADWAVHRELAASWQELSEAARQLTTVVSTGGSPEQSVARALAALGVLGVVASTPPAQ